MPSEPALETCTAVRTGFTLPIIAPLPGRPARDPYAEVRAPPSGEGKTTRRRARSWAVR
jgi:hypothetical protein